MTFFEPYRSFHLHIEASGDCNAACPLCPRNVWGSEYDAVEKTHGSLKTCLITELKDLDVHKVHINGNYGDICMHSEPIAFLKKIRETWPKADIHINTNGAALAPKIWERMHYYGATIEFGIDGITQESHSRYRRNTLLSRVLENAKAFIEMGGEATWAMTVFEYNEGEVEDAKAMAKELGFRHFVARPSTRSPEGKATPIMESSSEYYGDVIVTDWLWPVNPDKTFDPATAVNEIEYLASSTKKVRPYEVELVEDDTIDCWSQKYQSIYVDAEGIVYPCCWLGRPIYWSNVCQKLKIDPFFNNLQYRDIGEILDDKAWDILEASLTGNACNVCSSTCGSKSQFKKQVRNTIEQDL